jgi:2-dehydropantoate 2-reductase
MGQEEAMRICIFGAGAVGGHMAVKLTAAGHKVSVIARGPHLAAIRERGLTLRVRDQAITVRPTASNRADELGPQDAVIVTLKAPAVARLGEALSPLLGSDTSIVFAQNGIPWWYGHRLPAGRRSPPDLGWLDPGGHLQRAYGARALGGVIFSSNQVSEAGVVVNDSPERNMLVVGEFGDTACERVQRLRGTLSEAGMASPDVADIRSVLWSKLTANMTVSVMCLLTGLTALDVTRDPYLVRALASLVAEARAAAAAHGVVIPSGRAPRQGPNHKPSILQDYEQGREMEIDALVIAPLSFARCAGVVTPTLDLLAGLAVRKAMAAGLYRPGPEAAGLLAET